VFGIDYKPNYNLLKSNLNENINNNHNKCCRTTTTNAATAVKTVTTKACDGHSSVIVTTHTNCDGYFRRFLKNYHSTYLASDILNDSSDYFQSGTVVGGASGGGRRSESSTQMASNERRYYDFDRRTNNSNDMTNSGQLVTRTLSKTLTSSKRYTEFKKLLKNIGNTKKGILIQKYQKAAFVLKKANYVIML
jgi:hypothetical protein